MGSVVMAKKIEWRERERERERERDQLERKRAEEKLTVITVAVAVLDLIWSSRMGSKGKICQTV